ncbi:hypothetical protein TNCV_2967541 [Trichonephila clavipes]|nr:hypothetical protein TNCV_2967541 [Trichonephila clavipes]
MDRLKFKLEIVEALSTSPPTKKSILTDDEVNSVVIPLAKRSKLYNPAAVNVMAFILAIQDKRLDMYSPFDVLMTFQGLARSDLKTTKAVRKHVGEMQWLFMLVKNKIFL